MTTSNGSALENEAMSPSANSTPGVPCCAALASIAGDESTPRVRRAPSRPWAATVSSPVPHPRAATEPSGTGRTSPRRSKNGAARSVRNLEYWSGSQLSLTVVGGRRCGYRSPAHQRQPRLGDPLVAEHLRAVIGPPPPAGQKELGRLAAQGSVALGVTRRHVQPSALHREQPLSRGVGAVEVEGAEVGASVRRGHRA